MAETHTVPSSRMLTRPYYLLRTSDARNHFFRYEIARAIFHSSDPISRFLPRGEVVGKPDARTHPSGEEPKLEYDLSEFELEDPRPLDYLTDSEIDAFASAIDEFLLRSDSARQVSSYERDLRDAFRLPDPTKEKDAYWTYGPKKDRKLLILHGCEFEPESSWEPDKVVSHLRENCRLPWGLAQEHIIERLVETQEPLAYVVGRPAGSGLAVNGRVIPNDQLKPIKRFPEKMTQAFRLAAEDFYRRAHEDSGTEASEIELRSQFRLPDPAKRPECFFSYKSDQYTGVVISLSETAKEDECLPLCPDPKISNTLNSETLADRMGSMKPSLAPMIGGIAAGVALVAGLGIWLATRDTTPPEIDLAYAEKGILAQDRDMADDRTTVTVQFSEAIKSDSFVTDQGESSIVIRHDKTDIPLPLARLPEVSGELKNQLVFNLEKPMEEGEDYRIEFGVISDLSGNETPANFEVDFEFEDITPPAYDANTPPTSQGNGYNLLRMFFTDELDERTATDLRNYQVEPIAAPGSGIIAKPLDIQKITLAEDARSVVIRVAALDNPFVEGQEYRAFVSGIEDTSGNEVDEDEPLELAFTYRDSMAPTPLRARADSNQFDITVEFDEVIVLDLDDIDDYVKLSASSGSAPDLRTARLDASRQRLIVEVATGMRNGVDYTIELSDIQDKATPPNTMLEPAALEFKFEGESDVEGPKIASVNAQYSRMIITFDEEVAAKVSNPSVYSRFSLSDEFGNENYTITSAKFREDKPNMLLLVTAEQLPEDVYFTLKYPGVEDKARNVAPNDSSFTFATRSTYGEIAIQQAVYESESNVVRVKFNRRPEASLIENKDWIRLPAGVTVESVEFSKDNPTEILVKTSGVRNGIKYTLEISRELKHLNGGQPPSDLRATFDGPAKPVN